MTNMTHETIEHLTDEELAELPLATLRALFEDTTDAIAAINKAKRRVVAAVEAKALYIPNTGSTRIEADDTVVTITRPKRVEWDQDQLREAQRILMEEWGEAPSEYVDEKLSVAETKYNAWPAKIQALFEPARTVKAGATSIKFSDPK